MLTTINSRNSRSLEHFLSSVPTICVVGDESQFRDLPRWIANQSVDGTFGAYVLPLANYVVPAVETIVAAAERNPKGKIPLFVEPGDSPSFQMYTDVAILGPTEVQNWKGCFVLNCPMRGQCSNKRDQNGRLAEFSNLSHGNSTIHIVSRWTRKADLSALPPELLERVDPSVACILPPLKNVA